MARAQFHLGGVAHEQTHHDEARKLLEESQRLFEQLGDRAGIGDALTQRARIEYRYHNVAEVERLGKRALDILRTTDEYEQTIDVLRFLAPAAAHQGQHALADQYCREAMRLCDDGQYQAALPHVLYAWMQLCYRRGDFDLARQYGEKSIALFTVTGDRKSQSAVLEYLVRVYLDLRDYVSAEERSRESLVLSQELQDDWGIIYALRGMGKLFTLTNRRDDARRVWTEALLKAQTLNHPLEEELRKLLLLEEI